MRHVQVAVFATAPLPGFANKRLIPSLGPCGAGRLQRQLTQVAVRCALDACLGPVTLWCTPHNQHRFFRALNRTSGVNCFVHSTGNLGNRTHVAFRLHCTRGPVLVIGTDCPVLRPEQLRIAAQALIDGDDAVFYPTDDGGYAAVGLRRPQAGLFVDMTSGTADVMSQARGRAHALGLRVREPETLWNVSVPADLARLDALGLGAAP